MPRRYNDAIYKDSVGALLQQHSSASIAGHHSRRYGVDVYITASGRCRSLCIVRVESTCGLPDFLSNKSDPRYLGPSSSRSERVNTQVIASRRLLLILGVRPHVLFVGDLLLY